MGNINITDTDKLQLRNSAKATLDRLEKIQSATDTMQLLDSFKNKYNICETVYKVILKEHQKKKGKTDSNYLKVTMQQVPYALKFAGYSFENELLNELFGAKSKKGKTVKKLRDAVTHGINEQAVREIIMRKDELFGYMNEFLNTIKIFDQAEL